VFSVMSVFPNCLAEGEYAPADAFVDGSSHPYYGSGDPWNRRFFIEHLHLYGRRGQRQMLDILEGRVDDAIKYCVEVLERDPDNNVESLFTLTVARCVQQDYTAAANMMEKAVEKGIPFERFLAGPRGILKPLRKTEQYEQLQAKYNIHLIHGPMLGCLTDSSARFWVRTLDEVPVQIFVSESEELSHPIKSSIISTSSKVDYTAVFEIRGLKSDTRYYYDVIINGKASLSPDIPSFYTYNSPGSEADFRIAFGGGALYNPPNERMWDTIRSRNPQALLLLGDNVYIDLPGSYGEFHKYTYYRRQSRPEFRRLIRSVPVFAIWDDHDCATDDVWMGPYRDRPAWKRSQIQGYKENWNNPGYGTKQWPGCWFKFSISEVDFFMLDGRTYRTNPLAPDPTMLGPVQKAWLMKEVTKSKAAFKVLVSPVPWAFSAKDSHDTWNGFKREREEIFSFLEKNKINGVVLISADRHRSDARRIDRAKGYPLYEFESSRLVNQHVHKVTPGAIFGYSDKQSFGLVSFNTNKTDPTVQFDIINIDNEKIHSITIPLSEISFGTWGKQTVYIDNKPVKSNDIVLTVGD